VNARNPAHRLYLREGFSEIRRDGERIIMVKPLSHEEEVARCR